MTAGRSRLWWFRQPWPWKVADVLNRLGWCWSDLVSWALDRASDRQRHPDDRRLRDTARRAACGREPDSIRNGTCYCGQVKPDAARCLPGGAP